MRWRFDDGSMMTNDHVYLKGVGVIDEQLIQVFSYRPHKFS